MKTEEIRIINENQGTGRVFFHTYDNRTIVRTMTSGEVQRGQLIRKAEGVEAMKVYFVELFNNSYSEPQKLVKGCASDRRFFEGYNLRKTRGW